jgi:hypothetical protein
MLEDGLSYPTRGDEWIGRFVIGAILTVFSILIVPAVLIMGYFLRAFEHTIDGRTEPPEWDDWGALFVDGLKAIVVTVVYSIVPFAVFGTLAFLLVGAGASLGDTGGGLVAGFGLLTLLMMIPAMALVYYFIPAALGNMARKGTFGAAFDPAVIKQVAFSGEYLAAVLLPIVISLVVNFVTAFLAATIVGLVLVPFVGFYGQLAIFRMFGIAFRERINGTTNAETVASPAV